MEMLTVGVGLLMAVGLIGIVVPVLPGLVLVWAGVLIWALDAQTGGAWAVLGVATAVTVTGFLLQYLLPGRRMRRAGVKTSSTLAGAALAIVGFFVIPVIGLFVGFALGIYLVERMKLGAHAPAWVSTLHALKAIALSMGIELLTGLAVVAIWVIGVVTAT